MTDMEEMERNIKLAVTVEVMGVWSGLLSSKEHTRLKKCTDAFRENPRKRGSEFVNSYNWSAQIRGLCNSSSSQALDSVLELGFHSRFLNSCQSLIISCLFFLISVIRKFSSTSFLHHFRRLPLFFFNFSAFFGFELFQHNQIRRDFTYIKQSASCNMSLINLFVLVLQNYSSFTHPHIFLIIFLSNIMTAFVLPWFLSWLRIVWSYIINTLNRPWRF